MRYPEFLHEGGTIGFVAPSFGCTIEPYKTAFEESLKRWEEKGFSTVLGPNCYADSGLGISASPEECAAELMEAFSGESDLALSDALISCGGGELMCEILPYLDFARLKAASAKWFMGYSDNTNLGFPLAVLCDTASIYGPCAPAFGQQPRHEAVQMAEDLLCGKRLSFTGFSRFELESLKDEEDPLASYNLTEPSEKLLYVGGQRTDNLSMKGRLLGGCLDCLQLHCGTKYDKVAEFNEKYGEDGILWFLESCDLTPMGIRRALWQLREAGWFAKASGFIIGRPMHYHEEMLGLDCREAALGILKEFGVPVLLDADLGHLPPTVPIVQGALGEVKAKDGQWSLSMTLA